ncbi:MAG TPA: patatin-like phospholipase family protein [Gammaproteobacteria bacterium]|nr:patatin-like phospholipase family protein [Gammaproteobacteria bacterium]
MSQRAVKADQRIALVLQGGGALGAFQAGVFESLTEHGYAPDWIAGTSIGAINGAIIAGNRPEHRVERLREFWRRVAHRMPYHGESGAYMPPHGDALLAAGTMLSATRSITFGQPNFFRPRLDLWAANTPEKLSYYDTQPLRKTLEDLVDFEYLNRDTGIRLTVGAVNVRSGEMHYFDTRHEHIGPDHIRASGALPPGFPPVRIHGELFWDGGIYSNTPLEVVLDQAPRHNTLCFMVNLWNETGREPTSMADVYTREKEIRYASRFRQEIEAFRQRHNLRRTVTALYEELPADKRDDPAFRDVRELGCHTTMHIVRLGREAEPWEPSSKDVDFEYMSLRERWQHGYEDAERMIGKSPWKAATPGRAGVAVHSLEPHEHASGDVQRRDAPRWPAASTDGADERGTG